MNRLVLILVVAGALNWFAAGVFQVDMIAAVFGGQAAVGARIVYSIIGLAGIWAVSFWGRVGPVRRRR